MPDSDAAVRGESVTEGAPGVAPAPPSVAPRWLIILAWSTGLAGAYALASLAHAALVERILSVDVGFGRGLAFWVGTVYLALLGWGFLAPRPAGWYARRTPTLGALAVGIVGAVVCGTSTALWLAAHGVPAVVGPVSVSIVVLVLGAVAVLWLAARDDRRRSRTP
jgi:hypothetical protein